MCVKKACATARALTAAKGRVASVHAPVVHQSPRHGQIRENVPDSGSQGPQKQYETNAEADERNREEEGAAAKGRGKTRKKDAEENVIARRAANRSQKCC